MERDGKEEGRKEGREEVKKRKLNKEKMGTVFFFKN